MKRRPRPKHEANTDRETARRAALALPRGPWSVGGWGERGDVLDAAGRVYLTLPPEQARALVVAHEFLTRAAEGDHVDVVREEWEAHADEIGEERDEAKRTAEALTKAITDAVASLKARFPNDDKVAGVVEDLERAQRAAGDA